MVLPPKPPPNMPPGALAPLLSAPPMGAEAPKPKLGDCCPPPKETLCERPCKVALAARWCSMCRVRTALRGAGLYLSTIFGHRGCERRYARGRVGVWAWTTYGRGASCAAGLRGLDPGGCQRVDVRVKDATR